ncbi:MAG TPA: hypothetical protein VN520_35290 [Streptomyces sp.]|uniref:hypothetical protein n=1 Tax=Streptomyces sp. TaxID=1931 RepID=UPI002D0F7043|nr:hypothetical protein [Streptomyces sp.]HWU11561.1 hypothetical protein [Streptomyces sp.]
MLATTSHDPGIRGRLLQQMDRLFANDRGLGVLVEYNGRPDMSERDKDLQLAWADALIALHGRNRAASIYSSYASKRRAAEAGTLAPVGSWDNLVLGSTPIPRWQRDLHDFLCVVCGESFPSVLIDHGQDPACCRCARKAEVPTQALPLWMAYSHHRFATPGLRREEVPNGEATVTFTFEGGQTRPYVVGEAGLFYSDLSRLPGLVQKAVRGAAEDLNELRLVIDASVERHGRGFDITAVFSYDSEPEGSDGPPYGFRFVDARMVATHGDLSQPVEYKDVYQLLEAILTALYAPSPVTTSNAPSDPAPPPLPTLPSEPVGEAAAPGSGSPAAPVQAPADEAPIPTSDGGAQAPEPTSSPRASSSGASPTGSGDRSPRSRRLRLALTVLAAWAVCFAGGLLLLDSGDVTAAAASLVLGGASVTGLAMGIGLIRLLRRRFPLMWS